MAVLTEPKDRQMIQNRLELKLPADHLCCCVQVVVAYINNTIATLAYKMVMGMIGHDLVFGTSATQIGLAQYAQISKPFKRAVHRREIYTALGFTHLLVNPLHTGMPIQRTKRLKDGPSLWCDPAAMRPDPLDKIFELAHLLLNSKSLQLDYKQDEAKVNPARASCASPCRSFP